MTVDEYEQKKVLERQQQMAEAMAGQRFRQGEAGITKTIEEASKLSREALPEMEEPIVLGEGEQLLTPAGGLLATGLPKITEEKPDKIVYQTIEGADGRPHRIAINETTGEERDVGVAGTTARGPEPMTNLEKLKEWQDVLNTAQGKEFGQQYMDLKTKEIGTTPALDLKTVELAKRKIQELTEEMTKEKDDEINKAIQSGLLSEEDIAVINQVLMQDPSKIDQILQMIEDRKKRQ